MIVVVALAGGAGAAARFGVDAWVTRRARTVPGAGTLVVNATACLLLGALTGWLLAHPGHDGLRAALGVGFLGGYSTFSTASVEGARLLLTGRVLAGAVHALGMLLVCLAATVAGLALTAP